MNVTVPPEEAPERDEAEEAAPVVVLSGLVVLGAEDAPACSDGLCV